MSWLEWVVMVLFFVVAMLFGLSIYAHMERAKECAAAGGAWSPRLVVCLRPEVAIPLNGDAANKGAR